MQLRFGQSGVRSCARCAPLLLTVGFICSAQRIPLRVAAPTASSAPQSDMLVADRSNEDDLLSALVAADDLLAGLADVTEVSVAAVSGGQAEQRLEAPVSLNQPLLRATVTSAGSRAVNPQRLTPRRRGCMLANRFLTPAPMLRWSRRRPPLARCASRCPAMRPCMRLARVRGAFRRRLRRSPRPCPCVPHSQR